MRLFTLTASLSESYLSFAMEMQRLHHLLPPCFHVSPSLWPLARDRVAASGAGGPKAAARRATIPPSPPCAAQPMLLTRGLKVESFPAAPPPPPRSLLPNHLHPPPPNTTTTTTPPRFSSKLACSLLEKKNKTKTNVLKTCVAAIKIAGLQAESESSSVNCHLLPRK